jgi:hypothetical protein
LYGGAGSTPIPDPTVLTNQAVAQATDTLRRELMAAVALLDAKLEGQHDVIETRLAGMDEAVRLIAEWRKQLPKEIKDEVNQLERLGLERFGTIQERFHGLDRVIQAVETGLALRFKELETRSEREARDNKVAVDAAFAAQKEAASEQNKSNTLAISKSEAATSETLNKQADLFKSTTDALGARIEDSKQLLSRIDTRLTAIESRGVQVRETQGQSNWVIGAGMSVLALLISLAGLIVVLVKLG